VKAFILGIIVALACVAVAVYIYFATGMAPVATSAQAMPFEKALASKALHARAQKEMPKNPSMQPTEADYTAAAHEYVEHCALCHGVPGKDATAIADGMFPKPPQLFNGKGVTDDPPGETYWKIQNGIRLSGMPAFKAHLSDQETCQAPTSFPHRCRVICKHSRFRRTEWARASTASVRRLRRAIRHVAPRRRNLAPIISTTSHVQRAGA